MLPADFLQGLVEIIRAVGSYLLLLAVPCDIDAQAKTIEDDQRDGMEESKRELSLSLVSEERITYCQELDGVDDISYAEGLSL